MSERINKTGDHNGKEGERSVKISGSGRVTGGDFDSVSISGSGVVSGANVKSIKINGSGRVEGFGNEGGESRNAKTARSATINGSGVIAGGTYSTVSIHGSGTITSDLVCDMLSISGSGKVQGKVFSENAGISGSGTVDGDLQSITLSVNGSTSFQSSVSCTNLDVAGSASIRGNLNAQSVKICGKVTVGGDCSAERFFAEGTFDVGGLLNADEIDIRLHSAKSRAKEIGGERITVTRGLRSGLLRALVGLGFTPRLEAELIEGNEISLENTTAKVVRGGDIVLGKGCDIGLVEYTGTLRMTEDAKCAEQKKV